MILHLLGLVVSTQRSYEERLLVAFERGRCSWDDDDDTIARLNAWEQKSYGVGKSAQSTKIADSADLRNPDAAVVDFAAARDRRR